MSDGNVLLSQLDANKQSLAAKQAEMKGFMEEKTANLNALDTLMKVSIPEAQRAVGSASSAVVSAQRDYQTNVDNAKARVTAAYNEKQSKYASYQKIAELSTLWTNRYKNGCAWTGAAGGWQGVYCGEYGFLCKNSNVAPMDQNAPQGKCLDVDHRKARQQYALSLHSKYAADKNTAYSAYQSAASAHDKALKDQATVENNRTAILSAESAKQKAIDVLNGLTNPVSGKQVTIQKRISYIDQQIVSITKTISELERERSVMESRYQEFLADEVAKQKILEEQAKKAAAERDQVAKMTEASIQANLAPTDPLKVKAQENKMIYILGIGALALGTIYILKK